jgi:hypothetical protein
MTMDQAIKPNATLVPKMICGDILLSLRLCRLSWVFDPRLPNGRDLRAGT